MCLMVAFITVCVVSSHYQSFEKSFVTHGLPDNLVSDNATGFTSEKFQEFNRQNCIHHITNAPFHRATNGLAEREVRH